MAHPYSLPEGYILDGRYVLGAVARYTAGGIVYTAFDRKLRMMVEVLEYIPADCAGRTSPEDIHITGQAGFAEKREKLRIDGEKRMHRADSNIYDMLTANGTVYLVHVAPRNNAAPAAAAPAVSQDSKAPDMPTSETKIVTGILPHDEPASSGDDTGPIMTEAFGETAGGAQSEESGENTAEMLLTDPALPRAARPRTAEDTGGPNVKMLLGILAAGIILLVICCVVFLTSLFELADIPGDSESLMGIPYTEIDSNTHEDWIITGRGSSDNYAPGMVIAEETDGDGFRVTINGQTPVYTVPDLVGMTAEGAELLLDRTPFTNSAGLVQGQVTLVWEDNTDSPHGTVIRQSPEAGSSSKSSMVTLTLARNSNTFQSGTTAAMPDLVGDKYAAQLQGYPLVISDKIVSEQPEGEILHQVPAAGAQYTKGAPCYVVISAGDGSTFVPDVQFMTLAEAEAALYASGLSCSVEYKKQDNLLSGLVASQSPAAGESAAFGETVVLTVSGEGKWDGGPVIRTEQSDVVLSVGDTCTMELAEGLDVVYHSLAPSVVSVDENGLVKALSSGMAAVSASAGGNTLVTWIQVDYDNRLPHQVNAGVEEKISLPALDDSIAEGTVWYLDDTMVTVDENGILTGKKAGSTLLWGVQGGRISLYSVKLEEAEKEPEYVTVSKSTASDLAKLKSALSKAGLSYKEETEFSSQASGKLLRLKYTGYSDDKSYYFSQGTTVTLIVSKGSPDVTSISVETMPKKLSYTTAEKLDTAGLTIRVVYEDKTEEVISKGFTTSYDFTSAGRKTVAISYEQRKTSFAVTVTAAEVKAVKAEISSKPDKLRYQLKETLDTDGLEVKVTYSDGSAKTFDSGFKTSYSFDKAGTSRVTVTVEGVSAYFDVTVDQRKIQSIKIFTMPDKTVYTIGENISTTGMSLTAAYSDGSTETIRSGWSAKADVSTTGRKTVTVAYAGLTTTYQITVEKAEVVFIQVVSLPDKLSYRVNEEIDLTGLELSVTRSNSQTMPVSYPDDGITWNGDLSREGETKITVYYEGKSADIRVYVAEPVVEKLTVLIMPDKVEYEIGEKLDTTGMVLLAEYADGSVKRIRDGYTTEYSFKKAGESLVWVDFREGETYFSVTVLEPAKKLTVDPAELDIPVGESALLTIRYDSNEAVQLSCTVDKPDLVEIRSGLTGLTVKGLAPGKCTITVTDGTETAVCTVYVVSADGGTVTDTPQTPPVKIQLTVEHETTDSFMPMLGFTGNGVAETVTEFSVTVTYDDTKLLPIDTGAMTDGITITADTLGSLTISGTISVPKDGTVYAAYIMFYGSDQTAFGLTVN